MINRALRHPGVWLIALTLVGLVNQMLFSVYASREPAQAAALARALPEGWFHLASPEGWLDGLLPRTSMLALTALRVQAAIELPLTMLAYLIPCRWLGPDVFDRALRLRWATSVVWTTTFCLVEAYFPTPYTAQDIVIRVISGLVAPVLIGKLAGPTDARERPFAVFLVSTAALGGLVLLVYDVLLLYNLGDLVSALPVCAVLAAALVLARLSPSGPVDRGPVAVAAISALGEFVVLFFVPALPIRYGLVVGLGGFSALVCVVVVVVAVRRGRAYRLVHACAAGVGLVVGFICSFALPARYLEVRLLLAATGFLAAALLVCWTSDRFLRLGVRWRPAR